ncbi:MAG: ABC transporter permease [Anaerolineae bacterium]|nr:ABC transporter permease [Anaerolineae bacterium]
MKAPPLRGAGGGRRTEDGRPRTALGRRLAAVRRRRSAVVGGVIVLLVLGTALLSLVWTPHPYQEQDLGRAILPPFWMPGGQTSFALGTDLNGRDLLSRIMVGAQASLFVGIASVLVGGALGVTLGLLAGYFGGWFESLVMRLVDVQLSMPGVLLAIAILAAIGKGLLNVVLVLGIVSWVQYARFVRGSTLAVKGQEYVAAARAVGATHSRIVWRHVFPNILPPLLTVSTINVSSNILAESALSYLGVGVPLSTVTWGGMLNEGKNLFELAWWNAAWPGLAILLIVFGINLLGDGLNDASS